MKLLLTINQGTMTTTEEFLNGVSKSVIQNSKYIEEVFVNEEEVKDAMIEFAKYHVAEALKLASENYLHIFEGELIFLNKESILNAYPLENIK